MTTNTNTLPLTDRYKAAWGKMGLTVSQVNKATGISPAMLYHYLRGSYIPTVAAFQLLNSVTGISPNFVLLGVGEPLTHAPLKRPKGETLLSFEKVSDFSQARTELGRSRTLEIHADLYDCRASEIRIIVTEKVAIFRKAKPTDQGAVLFSDWLKMFENE